MRSLDGQWTVDVIRLSLTGNNRYGECLRICRHGFFVAEARTIDELREHLDLAELEEALAHRRARQAWPRSCYRQQARRQSEHLLANYWRPSDQGSLDPAARLRSQLTFVAVPTGWPAESSL
jgi:hypothetical protein